MKRDETRRVHSLIGVLGIMMLALLMLVNIVGATPYAYIPTYSIDESNVVVIDTAINDVVGLISLDNGGDGVSVSPDGAKVYVTNSARNSMAVIDTATNTITSTVSTEGTPFGVAVSPDGKKVYVACRGYKLDSVYVIDAVTNTVIGKISKVGSPNDIAVSSDGSKVYVTGFGGYYDPDTVSVIDTSSNTVTATVPVGDSPRGVAVSPDGTRVYVANEGSNTVSVIDTVTNTVISTVPVGSHPFGVTVSSDGTKAYVTNCLSNTVSVIDTKMNAVATNVSVGDHPIGISIMPDGSSVYVVNGDDHNVSIIDTATNSVIDSVDIWRYSQAIGQFIGDIPVVPQPKIYPIANFSSNVTSGYAPLSVQFNDLSENATGWNWDFGDGATSFEKDPTHTYSVAGKYTVNLIARNENGTDSTLAMITVLQPLLPVANFSSSVTQGYVPFSVKFTDLSQYATGWNWDFGDGTYSSVHNPVYVYNKAGNYTVNLTVSNANGTDSKFATITALPVYPVAAFSAFPITGKAPLAVTFTDDSTGSPTSWKWSFGDGAYSQAKNPIYTYTEDGKYNVSLTVTNAVGTNTTIKSNYIVVSSFRLPIANFTSNVTSGIAPLNVSFIDTSANNPTAWKWTFGDGTNSTVRNPTHKYTKAGNYTVSLTATNVAGNNTTTKTNYIKVVTKPVATFSASPTSGKAPLNVRFADKSTGSPTSWSWNFGDKSTSTAQNPTHKYTKAGKYTVSLTVKNVAGTNTKTMTNYITVNASPVKPVAAFSASPTTGKHPLNVKFTDKSTGSPTSWSWNFGDKSTSTAQNPTHKYTKAGKYTVSLTVKNTTGSNTKKLSNYITVK